MFDRRQQPESVVTDSVQVDPSGDLHLRLPGGALRLPAQSYSLRFILGNPGMVVIENTGYLPEMLGIDRLYITTDGAVNVIPSSPQKPPPFMLWKDIDEVRRRVMRADIEPGLARNILMLCDRQEAFLLGHLLLEHPVLQQLLLLALQLEEAQTQTNSRRPEPAWEEYIAAATPETIIRLVKEIMGRRPKSEEQGGV